MNQRNRIFFIYLLLHHRRLKCLVAREMGGQIPGPDEISRLLEEI